MIHFLQKWLLNISLLCQWLSTPTDGLKLVWQGYSDFEQALLQGSRSAPPSSSARALSNRMVSSAQAIFTLSQKAYDELKSNRHFGGFIETRGDVGSCESPPTPLIPTNMDIWRVSPLELYMMNYEFCR